MTLSRQSVTARDVLEIVAGQRCPCGHLSEHHRAPTGELKGERWGRCRYHRSCGCEGLVDFGDYDEECP
ncbi:MAG TPA: hypothetical protein VF032_19575 [Thermoleophilaceae bacterium]